MFLPTASSKEEDCFAMHCSWYLKESFEIGKRNGEVDSTVKTIVGPRRFSRSSDDLVVFFGDLFCEEEMNHTIQEKALWDENFKGLTNTLPEHKKGAHLCFSAIVHFQGHVRVHP